MKKYAKVGAMILAAMMLLTTVMGLFGMVMASAASDYSGFYISKSGNKVNKLSYGDKVTVEFRYVADFSGVSGISKGTALQGVSFDLSYPWSSKDSSCKLSLTVGEKYDPNDSGDERYYVNAKLQNAVFMKDGEDTSFILDISDVKIGNSPCSYTDSISTHIPDSYFQSGSSSGSDDDDEIPYSSDIVIENVYLTDSQGERIDRVNKDSAPFNLVITYLDRGLREVDSDEFSDRSLEVYLIETGGFVPGSGQKGTLKYLASNSNEAPRFRATFRNLTFNGGANSIAFRAVYDVNGYDIDGKSATATVPQVETEEEEKMGVITPHIIVNEYSYGGESIVAGNNFSLNMSIKNTSSDMPLENIVMTITPYIPDNNTSSTSGGLTITSASNTYYMDSLGVGESLSHTIDLRAEPSAAVGSHRLDVKFQFQYVDEVNKKRESSNDEEQISIPVSQIDRFAVDPLTEVPNFLMTGEEGTITVSFVNRGKSTTYNVSGTILGEHLSTNGQSQHYGNLEAGKADSLDFDVLTQEAGDLAGEIVIQYEDENSNQNEFRMPFTIPVEGFEPPMVDFPGMDDELEPEEPPRNTFTMVFCTIGGLLIAAPTGLYLFKRVKTKGIEDIDEDF